MSPFPLGLATISALRSTAIQLERLLHSQGFGSRKACRQLIAMGAVTVNTLACDDPRQDVDPAGLVFSVDGEPWVYREKVYLLLHKPPGFECSASPQHHASVLSLLPRALVNRGVQPVGRLDQDTTGLLLLSDDGAFLHALASPRRHVPKRYLVTTRHPVTQALIEALRQGVLLHGDTDPVSAADATAIDTHTLAMTIEQGKYHQVKRMVAAAANRVEHLHRDRIGGLALGELPVGQWRYLTDAQMATLPYERAGMPPASAG